MCGRTLTVSQLQHTDDDMIPGIEIEPEAWTPIRNEVFTEILRTLEERCSAALFLVMYDRAYHSRSRLLAATVAQLARLTGIDARTVTKCLDELLQQKLVRQVGKGVNRSKTRRPVWKVPSATIDPKREGNWTPVPRNLILNYVPAYRNAVLLPLLIYHQNMNKLNYCWVGVPALSKRLKWSETRVNESLRYMYDKENWRSLHPDLPWPLRCKVVRQNGQSRRRFSVLAIEYEGSGKKAKMRLSKAFRWAFDLL